ncbi:hypothetical protein D3C77_664650 [compost metagenome]
MIATKLSPRNMSKLAGFCASMVAITLPMSPSARMTNSGVTSSAKIISVACTVSVQLTARKPPMNT